jgi:hypothetical protein
MSVSYRFTSRGCAEAIYVATRTCDFLVAGLANAFAFGSLVDIRMAEKHIFRMLEIVTDPVVAESPSMADITILDLGLGNIAVFDGPAEIGMALRQSADNDGCFDLQIAAATYNRHGMAQVAF